MRTGLGTVLKLIQGDEALIPDVAVWTAAVLPIPTYSQECNSVLVILHLVSGFTIFLWHHMLPLPDIYVISFLVVKFSPTRSSCNSIYVRIENVSE